MPPGTGSKATRGLGEARGEAREGNQGGVRWEIPLPRKPGSAHHSAHHPEGQQPLPSPPPPSATASTACCTLTQPEAPSLTHTHTHTHGSPSAQWEEMFLKRGDSPCTRQQREAKRETGGPDRRAGGPKRDRRTRGRKQGLRQKVGGGRREGSPQGLSGQNPPTVQEPQEMRV